MTETPWESRYWRLVTLLELLEGYAAAFWATAATLGQAIIRLETDDILHRDSPGHIGKSLAQLRELAKHANLRSVTKQCERIGEYIDSGSIRHDRLKDMILDALQRTGDELEERIFLIVPPEAADLYRKSTPFGQAVLDAFPRATEDISEAAKCLALNRATAAVFHLMRTMEAAVQSLSAKLNIANPERVWGMLLSDIAKKIESMPKGAERTKWSEVHAHLYHVKEAWRNDTMHPKQTYTFDEATEVFGAVKVFMNALAAMV